MKNKIPELKELKLGDIDYNSKVGKPKKFNDQQISEVERLLGVTEEEMETMSFEQAYALLMNKLSGTSMKQKRKILKELRKISKKSNKE